MALILANHFPIAAATKMLMKPVADGVLFGKLATSMATRALTAAFGSASELRDVEAHG